MKIKELRITTIVTDPEEIHHWLEHRGSDILSKQQLVDLKLNGKVEMKRTLSSKTVYELVPKLETEEDN